MKTNEWHPIEKLADVPDTVSSVFLYGEKAHPENCIEYTASNLVRAKGVMASGFWPYTHFMIPEVK